MKKNRKIRGLLPVVLGAVLLVGCGASKENGDEVAIEPLVGEDISLSSEEQAADTEQPDEGQAVEPHKETADPAEENGEGQNSGKEAFSYKDLTAYTFEFSSGAGAWQTSLDVEADGSFYGAYDDSDMGDMGEGYENGTHYYSRFSGRFGELTYVDDYTYYTTVESLDYEEEPGKEEIADEMRLISAEAYGITGADKIYFYLPGKPTDQLPEGFQSWCNYQLQECENGVMNFYGLYNEAQEEGFYSYQVKFDQDDLLKLYEEAKAASAEYDRMFAEEDMNQLTMNFTAEDKFYVWDNLLNRIWDFLKESLSEDAMQELKDSQRGWIKEKEAAVEAAGAEVEGGSMQPMVEYLTGAEWTEERVHWLMDNYVKP